MSTRATCCSRYWQSSRCQSLLKRAGPLQMCDTAVRPPPAGDAAATAEACLWGAGPPPVEWPRRVEARLVEVGQATMNKP
jgi:hypothetical protein